MRTRAVHQLVAGVAAGMTGKRRGPDREVLRDSVDVDDPRAQVGRRVGDGSVRQGIVHREVLLRTARELFLRDRASDDPDRLRRVDLDVLQATLEKQDFRTGRLDPRHDTIAAAAGCARITVIRALKRLKAAGLLTWIRRSRKTASEGSFAPQRKQTSNAYYFDHRRRMKRPVWLRYWQLLEAALRRLGAATPTTAPEPAQPRDPALAAALAGLGASVASASS